MKGLNLRIIVLACLVTLGGALLTQHFVYQRRVADPLLERISHVPGVDQVSYQTIGDRRSIALVLSTQADLPTVYLTASQQGAQALGKRFAGVIINDTRSTELDESYYRMHFYIQQGIATGLFTDMAAGLDQIAAQDHIESHRVFVDAEHVYLQLVTGEHVLYELVPRLHAAQLAASTQGGSV